MIIASRLGPAHLRATTLNGYGAGAWVIFSFVIRLRLDRCAAGSQWEDDGVG
jgi:hypothetical protein